MPQTLEKIGKAYLIVRKIQVGKFSEIYHAINTKTNNEYAIKVQPIDTQDPQLIQQCKLYNYLHIDNKIVDKGIPNIYCHISNSNFNALVMELLGPSIQSLFNQTQRSFSLKTILMLMDQMITRIQYLHSRSFLHRDIKPDNFCIGLNNNAHKIFLIDLGLAERFPQPKCKKYIVYRRGSPAAGEIIYASINTSYGLKPSYGDDMESLGYTIMYLLRKGMLPWKGLKADNKKDKIQKIRQKKISTQIQVLCKGYPPQFAKYLKQCRNLRFQQKPQYSEMRNMFRALFQNEGYIHDYRYDWIVLSQKIEKHQRLNKEKERLQKEKLSIVRKQTEKNQQNMIQAVSIEKMQIENLQTEKYQVKMQTENMQNIQEKEEENFKNM